MAKALTECRLCGKAILSRANVKGRVPAAGICRECWAEAAMPFQGDPCPVCRWPIGGWITGDWYRCHHCGSDVNVVTREARTDSPVRMMGADR